VEHLDGYIGKLVSKIEDLGLSDNTMIIFTSDNGPVPFIDQNSNGELKGYKRDLYEGGIRVPLVITWPQKIKGGKVSDHVSAFWDFFPTICEVAQITNYPATDGMSFLPELFGEKQETHEYLYWEFHWWKDPLQAVRVGKWKGVRNSPSSKTELYDLESDIGEKVNIANQNPEIVSEINLIMKNARTESNIFKIN